VLFDGRDGTHWWQPLRARAAIDEHGWTRQGSTQ
jgi:hypothetical protein